MLDLQLFGRFALRRKSGETITLATRNDRAVLARLALAGTEGCDRGQLATLLWPDRHPEQAHKSLRQSIFGLRRAMREDGVLPANRRQRLILNPTLIRVDVLVFQCLVCDGSIDSLSEAAALYRGPLLTDLAPRSATFEDWLRAEQTRLEDMACAAFARLAAHWLEAGDYAEAEAAARRLVDTDPLREEGHRLLMRALDASGRRNEALQQFHRLSDVLRGALDVRPDPDTVALYRRLRQDRSAISGEADRERPVTMPDRPGLVVLPFRFAEEQDVDTADGLLEELTVALAAYRWFFVISSLQSRAYAGRAVDPAGPVQELLQLRPRLDVLPCR